MPAMLAIKPPNSKMEGLIGGQCSKEAELEGSQTVIEQDLIQHEVKSQILLKFVPLEAARHLQSLLHVRCMCNGRATNTGIIEFLALAKIQSPTDCD